MMRSGPTKTLIYIVISSVGKQSWKWANEVGKKRRAGREGDEDVEREIMGDIRWDGDGDGERGELGYAKMSEQHCKRKKKHAGKVLSSVLSNSYRTGWLLLH